MECKSTPQHILSHVTMLQLISVSGSNTSFANLKSFDFRIRNKTFSKHLIFFLGALTKHTTGCSSNSLIVRKS